MKSIYLEFLKIRDQTMKVRGNYSMKRVMVAFLFPLVLWMSIYIVINIKDMAFSVLTAILAFLGLIMGINYVGKKSELKTIENIVNDKETE